MNGPQRSRPSRLQRLGERIRQLRLSRGWGIDTLASRAKLSRTTLHNLENGTTANPRASTLKRLAETLDVTVGRLLEDRPEPLVHVPAAQTDDDRRQLDRHTNPLIDETLALRPRMFDGWSPENWDELYSEFGMGGALTQEGVIEAATRINRKRQTLRQLEVVLETDLAEVAARMIDSLYEMVKAPDPESQSV